MSIHNHSGDALITGAGEGADDAIARSKKAESRLGLVLCDKWRHDRVLGVGGMASVYQASYPNLKPVAVKLLHSQWSLDNSTMRRFLREGYVANSIRQSGAVQILADYSDYRFKDRELIPSEKAQASDWDLGCRRFAEAIQVRLLV